MYKTRVLAIVGPTATGKSALAMAVAQRLPVEIVCMDSMQVYRGMDIGTAKPTYEEQRQAPHHILDVVEPTEAFSVSQYKDMAASVLHEIEKRGKLPLLVGGTGLYLKALKRGLPLGGATSSEELRRKLHAMAKERQGKERLHEMLLQADPATGKRLHPNDVRRVIRALEIYELTGKPMSQQNAPNQESEFHFESIGATLEREVLYQRLNERVDGMMARGLLREVEGLLANGVTPDCQSMQGIGYKELVPLLQGRLSPKEAVDRVKRNTRRYAKRQWTWFRGDKDIKWLEMSQPKAMDEALEIAKRFWGAPERQTGEKT